MSHWQAVKAVFSFFFKTGKRSGKTRFFVFLSLTPVLIQLILYGVGLFDRGFMRDIKYFTGEMIVQVYFLFSVQLLALFYGSSVINEEVDGKTLTFLITRPIPKAAVLAGKWAAYSAIPLVITVAGIFVSFAFYFSVFSFEVPIYMYLGFFLQLSALALLHIAVYGSFAAFLGTLLHRPMILGFIFIFGLENAVRFLPGPVQRWTLGFYLRPLLPSFNYSKASYFLEFRLQDPSPLEAILILVPLSLLFLALATAIFYRKEYPLTDNR